MDETSRVKLSASLHHEHEIPLMLKVNLQYKFKSKQLK